MSGFKVLTLKEFKSKGINVDVLFWIGCAGSFDERSKKITKSFVKILNNAKISFGVLGTEESCTGDPAKRSGNEYLFQMQAAKNIETLKKYKFNKIVTTCPHCFNTLKNEYPELGANYDVTHHTEFLEDLFNKGKLKVLVRALKEIQEELESEIYSDTEAYTQPPVGDVEEVWDDDDGYPD